VGRQKVLSIARQQFPCAAGQGRFPPPCNSISGLHDLPARRSIFIRQPHRRRPLPANSGSRSRVHRASNKSPTPMCAMSGSPSHASAPSRGMSRCVTSHMLIMVTMAIDDAFSPQLTAPCPATFVFLSRRNVDDTKAVSSLERHPVSLTAQDGLASFLPLEQRRSGTTCVFKPRLGDLEPGRGGIRPLALTQKPLSHSAGSEASNHAEQIFSGAPLTACREPWRGTNCGI